MRKPPNSRAELRVRQAQLRAEMRALETVISVQLEDTPSVLIPEILRDGPPNVGGIARAGLSALTGQVFDSGGRNGNGTSDFQKLVSSPLGRMLLSTLVAAISKKIGEGIQHLVSGNGQSNT